jgi:hypothetical protein
MGAGQKPAVPTGKTVRENTGFDPVEVPDLPWEAKGKKP